MKTRLVMDSSAAASVVAHDVDDWLDQLFPNAGLSRVISAEGFVAGKKVIIIHWNAI